MIMPQFHEYAKRYYLIVLILFFNITLLAQEANKALIPKFEFHSYAGGLLIHRDAMSELGNHLYYGNEIQFAFQTTGEKYWQELFNYPSYGFAFYSGNFNNNAIGTPFAVYSFMELPFLRKDKLYFSTSWGVGLAFNINEYDSIDNKANVAIGTDKNVYVDFSANIRYKLSSRFELGTGLKLQHFSNGAIKQPNLGLNMISGQIALTYYPWSTIEKYTKNSKPNTYKDIEYTTMVAFGGTGKDSKSSEEKYFNTSFSFCASKRVNYKRNVGIGTDVFYNEYVKNWFKDDSITVPKTYLMSYGVFVSSDLIANRFRITTQIGTYIWRKTDYSLPIYERVALRYYFNNKLFGNFAIKAHGVKAQFIEYGVGITL